MAFVVVRKEGKSVLQKQVDDELAKKGFRIRVGTEGNVHLKLGQSKTVGKYTVTLYEGQPSEDAYHAVDDLKKAVNTFPPIHAPQGTDVTVSADSASAEGGKYPRIEGFEITGRLGEGGMGTVWRGIQLSTKREVAIKFLASHRFSSQQSRLRFEREVALAAKLNHPNIARIYDSGVHRGVYYYVMELIDGVHLDKYVQREELSIPEIMKLMRDICDAICHAHEHGIIHRDIKPSNIMVTLQDKPFVVDFGLAKSCEQENEDVTISIEGDITGTPAYMAPEQAAGHIDQISERTDVYALGVLMYQLLTGSSPHDLSGSRYDVIRRIVEEEIKSPRMINPAIDSELDSILLTCLAKEPNDRYPSSKVLLQDVNNYLRGEPLLSKSFSTTYRISKRIHKYKMPLVFTAFFLLIIGAVIVTAGLLISKERKKWLSNIEKTKPLENITAIIPADKKQPTQETASSVQQETNRIEQNPPQSQTPAAGDNKPNAEDSPQSPEKPKQAASPDQQEAKLQEKWLKALEDARREFQSMNDRESADFVGRILDSLDKSGGMSPSALAAHANRMESKTRELVRKGALENAAILNLAMWNARYMPGPGVDAPARAGQQRRSGSPSRADGLVLYLPFDAPPTNSIVLDESGAGNHGRVEGAQWVPEGHFGGAYQFHITNLTDRIVIPDSNLLNPEKVTVAAWIKTSDSDGFWNRIVDKDWRSGYNLCLGGDLKEKGNRGKLGFEANNKYIYSDQPLGDERWHHVAGTFDGKMINLYVDGVEKKKMTKNSKQITGNHWDLCIGNSVVDYGTGEFLGFDGLIDEVRVYNRVLSAEEIQTLASASQAGTPAIQSASGEETSKTAKPATDTINEKKEVIAAIENAKSLENKTTTNPQPTQETTSLAQQETAGAAMVTFKTIEPAPDYFDAWEFLWKTPTRDLNATFEYVVIQPDGLKYFNYTLDPRKAGLPVRSDFRQGLAGDDPSVFFNQHIRFTFRVSTGNLTFALPDNDSFKFRFFKKNAIGNIDWNNPFRIIDSIVEPSGKNLSQYTATSSASGNETNKQSSVQSEENKVASAPQQPVQDNQSSDRIVLSNFDDKNPLDVPFWGDAKWKTDSERSSLTSVIHLDSSLSVSKPRCLRWDYSINNTWVNVAISVSDKGSKTVDLTPYDSISFYIKGRKGSNGCDFQIQTINKANLDRVVRINIPIHTTENWEKIRISLSDLPDRQRVLLRHTFFIGFCDYSRVTKNTFWIDDVVLYPRKSQN